MVSSHVTSWSRFGAGIFLSVCLGSEHMWVLVPVPPPGTAGSPWVDLVVTVTTPGKQPMKQTYEVPKARTQESLRATPQRMNRDPMGSSYTSCDVQLPDRVFPKHRSSCPWKKPPLMSAPSRTFRAPSKQSFAPSRPDPASSVGKWHGLQGSGLGCGPKPQVPWASWRRVLRSSLFRPAPGSYFVPSVWEALSPCHQRSTRRPKRAEKRQQEQKQHRSGGSTGPDPGACSSRVGPGGEITALLVRSQPLAPPALALQEHEFTPWSE